MTAATRRRGVFVTGTDTGVGKTVVSSALVRGLRARGLDVGAMKPVETGVDERGPLDARALWSAAGELDPLELICPQRFALAAAPLVAARAEARVVELDPIHDAFARLSARHALLVVEGAGGLLVPLTPEVDMADLARGLDLPVLVVARAALGTINHTALTLRELDRRGIECIGVVVSHAGGELSPADAANLEALRQLLGDLLVGEIPPLEGATASAADHLDLDRIDARLTQLAARSHDARHDA